RARVQLAILISVSRDLGEPLAHDRAFARFDLIEGADLTGRDILGEILDRGGVLADERAERTHGLALGAIELLPQLAALHDHGRNDQAADHAVRDALAGIARVHIDILVAGIAAA